MERITRYYESRGIELGELRLVRGANKAELAGAIALCPPSALQRPVGAALSRSGRRLCVGLDARARARAPARRRAAAGHFRSRRLGRPHRDDRRDRRRRNLGHARPGRRAGALVRQRKACKARPLDIVGYGDEERATSAARGARRMNRFAELLDRLAYEPGRNNKLRLIDGLFPRDARSRARLGARRAHRRAVLPARQARHDPRADRGAHRPGAVRTVLRLCRRPLRDRRADVAGGSRITGRTKTPSLTSTSSRRSRRSARRNCPRQLARWLDALDETGRWALLKLVTGGLRIGVSARLAKTAAAALGGKDADEIELLWPGLAPPYIELFAWLEGRAEKPASARSGAVPARRCWRMRSRRPISPRSIPTDFMAEWKWDGIRVQAVARRVTDGETVARLYSRTGEDISKSFPDLIGGAAAAGGDRRRAADHARGPRAVVQRAAAAAQPQNRDAAS